LAYVTIIVSQRWINIHTRFMSPVFASMTLDPIFLERFSTNDAFCIMVSFLLRQTLNILLYFHFISCGLFFIHCSFSFISSLCGSIGFGIIGRSLLLYQRIFEGRRCQNLTFLCFS